MPSWPSSSSPNTSTANPCWSDSRSRSGTALVVVGAGYNLSFDFGLYVYGVTRIYAEATSGYLFYLFGESSADPWWYYYMAALLVKVPVPALLLIGFAVVSVLRNPRHRESALFLIVPALVVLVASCFDRANLGVRRVLPALPFLFLFAGQILADAKGRLMAAVVVLLVAWNIGEALRIYPHHLAYFNTLAGGPERGPHLLDDSNSDWGQDLPGLAAWQRAHPDARPFRLLYFGTAPPEAYGVRTDPVEQQDILQPRAGTWTGCPSTGPWII